LLLLITPPGATRYISTSWSWACVMFSVTERFVSCDNEVIPGILIGIFISRKASGVPCLKPREAGGVLTKEVVVGGAMDAVPIIDVEPPGQIVVVPVTLAVGEALTLTVFVTELLHPLTDLE